MFSNEMRAYLMDFHDALRNDPRLFENEFLSSNNGRIPPPSHSTSLDANPTYEDGSLLEHYQGSTSAPSTLNATGQGTPMADHQVNNTACCPPMRCLYPRADGAACLKRITCPEVPDHFREEHNIRNMRRDHPLVCRWGNCGSRVTRHNFVRHIREKHFNHFRDSGHND
ncbi:hypothetical protein EDD15DRAFT_1664409 [Pisolithus albus]|nr:hypothetical protein EDD15DRAFT_1664409 [Pisolithus albus]